MKTKYLLLSLTIILGITSFVGCSSLSKSKKEAPKTTTTSVAKTDTVSGASQAADEASFEQKVDNNGNYIVVLSKDLSYTKDIVVDGVFSKTNKEGKEVVTRVLALAKKSADGGYVSSRYTLTAPKLIINSVNTTIEYGTVKGDVYVQTPGFKLVDVIIEGNLYFATQEQKDLFKLDKTSNITGKIEVKSLTK